MRPFIVAAMLLVVPCSGLQSQAAPNQLDLIRAELAERGLTESEVRARLSINGIVLEQIPVSELPAYRTRIVAILDSLVVERRGATAGETGAPATPAANAQRTAPMPTAAEAATDSAKRMVAALDDAGIYGHDIFTDQTLEVFQTTDGARAPGSYVLGAGDQVRISIFGTSQADLLLEVNAEGFIQPTGVPKIYLRGLTLAQARPLLRARLSGFYAFNADQYAVTLQTARTVIVNVFGETRLRGSFSVSALNTALNALVAAGGPSALGSVRDIQLVRGAQRRRLDVYAFLNDPRLLFDFDLQHNDILFVPLAKTLVTVEGAVRRPMRYELVEGEDLGQLIQFAGGVNFNTYPDQVQIQRVEGDSIVLKDYRLSDVLAGTLKVAVRDGDVVRVRSIGRALEQVIEVEGAVFYEGPYDISGGQTLGQVLAKAQPRPDASDTAYLVRTDALNRELTSYLRVDLTRDAALPLKSLDRLIVHSRSVFTEIGEISVGGAVQNGSLRINYEPTLTVTDLLTMAGGFTPAAALDRVDVLRLRVDLNTGATFERIQLVVDSTFRIVKGPQNFRLQPFDQVIVRAIPNFTVERNVQLTGQVVYPGTYSLRNQLTRLSDLLQEAGGLTEYADPRFATILREGVGQIGIDLRTTFAAVGSDVADPTLLPGDEVRVERRQNTVIIRLRGTRVGELTGTGLTGIVDSLRTFVYQGRHDARWYIQEFAGGFGQEADRWSVTVTDPNGRVRGTARQLFFFKSYPEVLPGSTVTLRNKLEKPPSEKDEIDWDRVYNRTFQTLTTIMSLVILSRQF